ncbi:hypothetical protein, partial [Salmonella enterica]
RATIDTIEALTQLQQFQLVQNEALLQLTNTTLELSNYLWDEQDSVYLLPPRVTPDTLQFMQYAQLPAENEILQQALT